ncbi:MAG: M23 family metallopeptidase [Puniceicoccales bacterium]|jgi:hypothetical protein|nr:M23 family metallopeptidase [Puniceicoccales bacterium]
MKKVATAVLCLFVGCLRLCADSLLLPTDNGAVLDPVRYLQNAGTERCNGGFGLVRENGTKFHGGIDIKPVKRRLDGEPLDVVRSVADGTVVYANDNGDGSSYGKYVVVEHGSFSMPVLSIYAHLASISASAISGHVVAAGEVIGTVGRTAQGYEIPRDRAHLHFELALRLGDGEEFARWYGGQHFLTANIHDLWNGLNFASFDPLPLLRSGEDFSLAEHIRNLPTAFVTRIFTEYFPPFLRRYGALLDGWDGGPIGGFDVEWTWFGLPKRWCALPPSVEHGRCENVEVVLLQSNWQLSQSACTRETLVRGRGNVLRIGKRTAATLEKIFGGCVKILDSSRD